MPGFTFRTNAGGTVIDAPLDKAPMQFKEDVSIGALTKVPATNQAVLFRRAGANTDNSETAGNRPYLGILQDSLGESGAYKWLLGEYGYFFWRISTNTITLEPHVDAGAVQKLRFTGTGVVLDLAGVGGLRIPVIAGSGSLGAGMQGSFHYNATRDAIHFKHNGVVNEFRELFRAVAGAPDVPANLKDGGLAVDTTNHILYFLSGGTWRNSATSGAHVFEVPTGAIDGVNKDFTLSRAPLSVNTLLVFMNGQLQRPTTDYTLAGAVFTFTAGFAAPPVGSDIYALFW